LQIESAADVANDPVALERMAAALGLDRVGRVVQLLP